MIKKGQIIRLEIKLISLLTEKLITPHPDVEINHYHNNLLNLNILNTPSLLESSSDKFHYKTGSTLWEELDVTKFCDDIKKNFIYEPIKWKPNLHLKFRSSFRQTIFTLLLVNQRYDFIFPNEIMFMIFEEISYQYIPYDIYGVLSRYNCQTSQNQKKQIDNLGIKYIVVEGNYIMTTSQNFKEDNSTYNTLCSIINQ